MSKLSNLDADLIHRYAFDDATLSLKVKDSSVAAPSGWDYMAYTSGTTTDVYAYYQGGAGGTLLRTVTVTYTDGTKATLANVALT